MDDLIKLAQKQQQGGGKGKGQASPSPASPTARPSPATAGPAAGRQGPEARRARTTRRAANSPAEDSSLTEGGDPQVDLSRTIKEHSEEWGSLSPRERQAVMEGAGEKSFSKYDKFIKDYYRELAKKASER